jgi:hypothetical protein
LPTAPESSNVLACRAAVIDFVWWRECKTPPCKEWECSAIFTVIRIEEDNVVSKRQERNETQCFAICWRSDPHPMMAETKPDRTWHRRLPACSRIFRLDFGHCAPCACRAEILYPDNMYKQPLTNGPMLLRMATIPKRPANARFAIIIVWHEWHKMRFI